MSRGLGDLQRCVCEVLYAAGDGELPLRELRRRLGDPDRFNLRRAVRGLLRRGILWTGQKNAALRSCSPIQPKQCS